MGQRKYIELYVIKENIKGRKVLKEPKSQTYYLADW